MVKRVERHIIKPGHQFYSEIDALCLASKNLYNCVMYSARHSFFYGYGIPSLAQLHTFFKDSEQYKALPAKVSQLVIKQVCDAWDSYFKALEDWKQEPEKFTGKPKIPGYAENRNLVKYNNQAYSKKELKKGKRVHPSMSNIWVPAHPPITVDNLCEVRLVPKVGCYVIEIVYEVETAEIIQQNERVAAIDLGLDNLATVVFNVTQLQPFIINGKPLKAANQWRNKQKAWLQGLLPEGQHSSKRIEAITRKRNCYVDHYLHNASRTMVTELLKRGVSKVVIGKNADWKRNVNLGRVNNQQFVQIPYNKFIDLLTYKLNVAGIEVAVEEESYTSKASFLDWDSIPTYDPEVTEKPKFSGKRVKRSWYKASARTLIHADVNGAYNIGRKVIPTAFAHLQQIVARDSGCLVVHPRRITPVPRTKLRSVLTLLKTA